MTAFLNFRGHGPLVALLQGPCAGDTLARALTCPFLLASPDTRLEPAGAWPSLETVGSLEPGRARILQGEPPTRAMPAERALELGLLEQVVPADALPAAGQALLEQLTARRGDTQVDVILEVIQGALSKGMTRALEQEAVGFMRLARLCFGPVQAPPPEPASPRLPAPGAPLLTGGTGWGNVPPLSHPPGESGRPLRLERQGTLATLLLSDPPRNEMNATFFWELARRVIQARATPAPAGLVVRGVGRHFSSGADLEELGRRLAVEPDLQVGRFLADNIRTFQSLAGLPFPTVAAVGGCCLGSGLELALACRQRLAADNAVFSLPEAQYGLMPGCGGTVRLARLLGRGQAIKLILSGRNLMAAEALDLGLVQAVLPRRELPAAAEALAGAST